MCAARHPQLARGVLLLDSPILGGWKAHAPARGQAHAAGGRDLARRHQPQAQEPLALARGGAGALPPQEGLCPLGRRCCRLHHPRHHDEDGERVLAFDRDVETAIYNTLPDNLDRLLKRHPLKCPVAFIGGLQSEEMKQVGMAMTEKVTQGRIMMLDGQPLFPMEKPLMTAAAVEAALVFSIWIWYSFPTPCGCAEERRARRIRDRVV
jgi:pimeloyl-ACP methyl ester carboxylesterase